MKKQMKNEAATFISMEFRGIKKQIHWVKGT